MNDLDRQALEEAGWLIECESPLENIRGCIKRIEESQKPLRTEQS